MAAFGQAFGFFGFTFALAARSVRREGAPPLKESGTDATF